MLTVATSLLHWQVLCFVGPVVVVAAYMRISQYHRRIMAARAEANLRTRAHIAHVDPDAERRAQARAARARFEASPANQRQAAPWFRGEAS